MKLKDYMLLHSLNQTKFAKQANLPQCIIHRYLNSKTTPSLASILKIQRATSGLVTAEDFLDDVETPSSPVV